MTGNDVEADSRLLIETLEALEGVRALSDDDNLRNPPVREVIPCDCHDIVLACGVVSVRDDCSGEEC